MKDFAIYCPVRNKALDFAIEHLPVLPAPGTQTTHLLLPIPSFAPDGSIRGGGDLETILSVLPQNVTVIGGNLQHPVLTGYKTVDLLKDSFYVSENADITARCAIKLLSDCLPCTLKDCPVLIIGWGRIGKCLARLLRANDARVTVYARKETDRALLSALGYETQDSPNPIGFRAVINTAPAPVLPDCPGNALKMELSSVMGIGGKDVLWAKGLPAIHAPESSGKLIAASIYRLLEKEEPL
jgi:dipicolinate synthase subunit A